MKILVKTIVTTSTVHGMLERWVKDGVMVHGKIIAGSMISGTVEMSLFVRWKIEAGPIAHGKPKQAGVMRR